MPHPPHAASAASGCSRVLCSRVLRPERAAWRAGLCCALPSEGKGKGEGDISACLGARACMRLKVKVRSRWSRPPPVTACTRTAWCCLISCRPCVCGYAALAALGGHAAASVSAPRPTTQRDAADDDGLRNCRVCFRMHACVWGACGEDLLNAWLATRSFWLRATCRAAPQHACACAPCMCMCMCMQDGAGRAAAACVKEADARHQPKRASSHVSGRACAWLRAEHGCMRQRSRQFMRQP